MIIKMNIGSKLFLIWISSLFTGWVTRPYLDGRFTWWGDVLFCLALGIVGAIACMLVEKIPDMRDE